MAAPLYALVDCNNFYASCERLFRPDLQGQPIVVLSNNDGCVIARSAEAKALGVKMGTPAFQLQSQFQQGQLQRFSSNYALYADLSARVMRTLEQLAPAVEIYSIDEAFLDLQGMAGDGLLQFGAHIRQTIRQWQGLAVCVGIAPSKTLAKLANHTAKRHPQHQGVVALLDRESQRAVLADTALEDIWGIGRRLAERLQQDGYRNALMLADADARQLGRRYSVVLEKLIRELNGEACLALEQTPAPKQQIISSRSFGQRVVDKTAMQQAISLYVQRACQKLRQEHQQARFLQVFVRTSPFGNDPWYANERSVPLLAPSNDTRVFLGQAMRLLDEIWRDGFRYAKAGVMLSDFYPEQHAQGDLFAAEPSKRDASALMQTLDQINARFGRQVWFATEGTHHARTPATASWQMQRQFLSPAYTTQWNELPKAR